MLHDYWLLQNSSSYSLKSKHLGHQIAIKCQFNDKYMGNISTGMILSKAEILTSSERPIGEVNRRTGLITFSITEGTHLYSNK